MRAKRRLPRPVAALALAGALFPSAGVLGACGTQSAAAPYARAAVTKSGGEIVLTVPGSELGSGYKVRIPKDPLAMTTQRLGATVLGSTSGADTLGPLRFQAAGSWYHATAVASSTWTGAELDLELATNSSRYRVTARIVPEPDRYRLSYEVRGPGPVSRLGILYRLEPAGHWYGQGEVANNEAPWPLESGQINTSLSPAGGFVTDPFWFTSSGTGLWVATTQPMDTSLNAKHDGLGQFYVRDTASLDAEVFVEPTPRDAYRDYVGVVGKPASTDATYRQYKLPLWNAWPQFYLTVDQAKILRYTRALAGNGLPGHAVQVDGGWEANRGDFAFDHARFPDPTRMSQTIHRLGFDEGVWVSFYIAANAATFDEARQRGYLMADAGDPSKPCIFPFARSTASGMATGMVDLGNASARAWFADKLRDLMRRDGVDGFKFDYPNIPGKCAPQQGYSVSDYRVLQAAFARQFDLQGVGVRLHWGSQRYGFALREGDKYTDWHALRASVPQALAISTVGYPFVETDTIGGSAGGVGIEATRPPNKSVLVRWAQAASLMPLMYAGTLPVGTATNPYNGETASYDRATTDLYRVAIERHERLAPYIWSRVQDTVATGEPIMKPLFFDFPADRRGYTVTDEWLLGDAILAAPVLDDARARDVYLPSGRWLDVVRCHTHRGPTTLPGYEAPLDTSPVFVRLGVPDQTGKAMHALDRCPASTVGAERGPGN